MPHLLAVENTSRGKEYIETVANIPTGDHSEIVVLKKTAEGSKSFQGPLGQNPVPNKPETWVHRCWSAISGDPRFASMTEFQYFESFADKTMGEKVIELIRIFQLGAESNVSNV